MMHLLKKKIIKELAIGISFLLIAIAGYFLSLKMPFFKDLNGQGLSETTKSLLESFDEPLTMTLYSNDVDTIHQIKLLIKRYQILQPLIIFKTYKMLLKESHLPHHALIISYHNQEQVLDLNISTLNESKLSQALFKLQRKPNQWVVFLQGHDEPDPDGTKNTDFNLFRLSLENQGFKVQKLNLALTPFIPDNTSVLIINSIKTALLPKEEALIQEYIAKGKDLLWLMEPTSTPIESLCQTFGIFPHPGTIVDAHGQRLGTPHPAITIIEHYPSIPFHAPKTLTAFPFSLALDVVEHPDFQSHPLLITGPTTWTETGPLSGKIGFDPEKNEISGPLLLGVYLSQTQHPTKQRIAIIGNSRFLSNGAIENYGNLALGLNLLNWLNHDDFLIHIEQPIVKESFSRLHLPSAILIQYGYPLFCLFLGIFPIFIYFRRLHRSHRTATLTAYHH